MAYCGPRGIPLHAFLAWPRMSQDAALEWSAYESRRCSRCGSHPDEGPRHAHVDVCAGCVALDAASAEAREVDGGHAHLVKGAAGACTRCLAELEVNRRG